MQYQNKIDKLYSSKENKGSNNIDQLKERLTHIGRYSMLLAGATAIGTEATAQIMVTDTCISIPTDIDAQDSIDINNDGQADLIFSNTTYGTSFYGGVSSEQFVKPANGASLGFYYRNRTTDGGDTSAFAGALIQRDYGSSSFFGASSVGVQNPECTNAISESFVSYSNFRVPGGETNNVQLRYGRFFTQNVPGTFTSVGGEEFTFGGEGGEGVYLPSPPGGENGGLSNGKSIVALKIGSGYGWVQFQRFDGGGEGGEGDSIKLTKFAFNPSGTLTIGEDILTPELVFRSICLEPRGYLGGENFVNFGLGEEGFYLKDGPLECSVCISNQGTATLNLTSLSFSAVEGYDGFEITNLNDAPDSLEPCEEFCLNVVYTPPLTEAEFIAGGGIIDEGGEGGEGGETPTPDFKGDAVAELQIVSNDMDPADAMFTATFTAEQTILGCVNTEADDVEIIDPCSCDDPLNSEDSGEFLFHDYFQVYDPTGAVWQIQDISLLASGPLYTDALASTQIMVGDSIKNDMDAMGNPLGTDTLRLDFWAPPGTSFEVTFADSSMVPVRTRTYTKAGSEICLSCTADPIPTLSEWGLIILLLSLLTFGMVGLRRRTYYNTDGTIKESKVEMVRIKNKE